MTHFQRKRARIKESKKLSWNPNAIGMIAVFMSMHYPIYEGTVPVSVVARRRKKTKAQRIARRKNRG